MSEPYTPRELQRLGMEFLADRDRANLFAGMGTGKTSIIATTLADRFAAGEGRPAIVFAPLRVATMAWPAELAKWSHLAGLEYVSLTGTPKQREAALARLAKGDTPLALCNYDIADWLVERVGVKKWPFGYHVADESSRLKSFRLGGRGGRRAGALGKVAQIPGTKWINATGTPIPLSYIDLWPQNWFVDKGARLGRTFGAFTSRWFRQVPGTRFPVLEIMPHSAKEIERLMSDVTLVLRAEDYFPLGETFHNRVMVELPPKARALYKTMEREFFMQLEAAGVEAPTAAAKSMKLRQLAAGSVYYDEGKWEVVHSAKIDAVRSVVEESGGMPVLCVYHFKSSLAALSKAFPDGRALGKDAKTLDEWNAGKIPIMFVNALSAGHGLSLQWGSNTLCFYDLDFNGEAHLQVIERIGAVRQYQAGLDRPVIIHYIMADRTIDGHVFDVVTGKATMQEAFKQALLDFKAEQEKSS